MYNYGGYNDTMHGFSDNEARPLKYHNWRGYRDSRNVAFSHEFYYPADRQGWRRCKEGHRRTKDDACEKEWHEWCAQFVGKDKNYRPLWRIMGVYSIVFRREEDAMMFKMKFG